MMGRAFLWELAGGKRPYLILLFYFLVLLFSGTFTSDSVNVEIITPDIHILDPVTPGKLIDILWFTQNVWSFLFPVVTAYAVFAFSYELDKGILRTYLLSCIGKPKLFAIKLSVIFTGIFVPLVSGLLIAYSLADPILFASNPFDAYVNLPLRLVLYASMLYTMIGLSVLSAVAFKKPLYSFIIPIVTVYFLNNTDLGAISSYIPPKCFPLFSTAIGLFPNFWSEMSSSVPSIVASTIALITAFVIFTHRDVT
jgi:hypothetical protein